MTDTGFTKTAPVNGYVSPYPVDPMPDWVAALRDSAAPVWLFAYGSLMWNPAFHHTETVQGRVHGWSRKFCLWLHMARGSPDAPGLMLALDRGGACHGMAFRIAAAEVRQELRLLWRREMLTGAYETRWVRVEAGEGRAANTADSPGAPRTVEFEYG